jgi:hypothetical protein
VAALAPVVIEAKIEPVGTSFAARLVGRAAALATAQAENAVRARRRDPWRWRLPRLLWPLFAKG